MDAKTMYDNLKPEQQGMIYSAVLIVTELIRTAYAANIAACTSPKQDAHSRKEAKT